MRKTIIKIVVAVVIIAAAVTLVATGTAADVAATLFQVIPRIFAGG